MSDNNEIIPGGAEYRGKVVSLLKQISGENDGNGEVIPGGAAFRAKVVSLLSSIAESGGGGGGSGGNLPSGGTAGQFLVKQSATDYDAAWETVPNAQGVNF